MTDKLVLFAEREACRSRLLRVVDTFEEATAIVWQMERDGTWPEGHDAVLRAEHDGPTWMHVDKWEEITDG